MNNLKISTKLSVAFSVLLFLLLSVILLCSAKFGAMQSNLDQVVNENEERIELAAEMQTAVQNVSRIVRNIALLQDPLAQDAQYQQLQLERAHYDDASRLLEPHVVTAEGHALFTQICALRDRARDANDRVRLLALAGKRSEAVDLLVGQVDAPNAEWRKVLQEFQQLQKSRNKQRYADAVRQIEDAKREIDVVGALALLAGIAFAASIARSIRRPITDAIELLRQVADGDLRGNIPTERKDEIGHLMAELCRMQRKLSAILVDVQLAADDVVAKRSAQAASDINKLISGSVERVTSGGQLVEAAGKTMREVVGSIASVSAHVARISAASEDQSVGVSQIKEAIKELDNVTQSNAALVAENALLSHKLSQRAGALVESISVFKFQNAH